MPAGRWAAPTARRLPPKVLRGFIVVGPGRRRQASAHLSVSRRRPEPGGHRLQHGSRGSGTSNTRSPASAQRAQPRIGEHLSQRAPVAPSTTPRDRRGTGTARARRRPPPPQRDARLALAAPREALPGSDRPPGGGRAPAACPPSSPRAGAPEHAGGVAAEAHEQHARPRGRAAHARAAARLQAVVDAGRGQRRERRVRSARAVGGLEVTRSVRARAYAPPRRAARPTARASAPRRSGGIS